ncbi:hypothetical protein ACS0TY_027010 [Phlomoides rotata]
MAVQKFDTLKMLPNETIDQLDPRFTTIINAINDLDKKYTKKEIVLGILRALPIKRWKTKVTIIKNTKDISKMTTQQLVSTLKTHEFDLNFDEEVGETYTLAPSNFFAFKARKEESNM